MPEECEVGVVVLEGIEVDGVRIKIGQDPVLLLCHCSSRVFSFQTRSCSAGKVKLKINFVKAYSVEFFQISTHGKITSETNESAYIRNQKRHHPGINAFYLQQVSHLHKSSTNSHKTDHSVIGNLRSEKDPRL